MGRRKKKRHRSSGAAPSMMPMMMPQPAPASSSSSSSSSGHESVEGKLNSWREERQLYRGAVFLGKLPKIRLAELVEASTEDFDSVFTAHMEREDLCRLIWMSTGVRPNARAQNFRTKSYKELGEKFKVARSRMTKRMGKEAFDKMIERIMNNQYDLKRIAADMGYDEEWWSCCMVKKGGRRGAVLPADELPAASPATGGISRAPQPAVVEMGARQWTRMIEGQARRQQAELPLDPGLLEEHMRFIEWQEQQRLKAPAKAAGPSPPAAAPASAAPEAQRPAGLPLQPRRASAVPEAQQLAGPPPLAAAPASAAPKAQRPAGLPLQPRRASAVPEAQQLAGPPPLAANRRLAQERRGFRKHTATVPEANTTPAPPTSEGQPNCVICRDNMLNTESRLALPCGHVFHQECIQRYAEYKKCSMELACVYRCPQVPQPETPQSDAGGAAELTDSEVEISVNAIERDARQFAAS